jgi:hypothetical protein
LNDVAIGVRYGVRENGLFGVFLYAFASPEGKNSGSVATLGRLPIRYFSAT